MIPGCFQGAIRSSRYPVSKGSLTLFCSIAVALSLADRPAGATGTAAVASCLGARDYLSLALDSSEAMERGRGPDRRAPAASGPDAVIDLSAFPGLAYNGSLAPDLGAAADSGSRGSTRGYPEDPTHSDLHGPSAPRAEARTDSLAEHAPDPPWSDWVPVMVDSTDVLRPAPASNDRETPVTVGNLVRDPADLSGAVSGSRGAGHTETSVDWDVTPPLPTGSATDTTAGSGASFGPMAEGYPGDGVTTAACGDVRRSRDPDRSKAIARRTKIEELGEIRGLWVVRHTLSTEADVREAVKTAVENNFNALFVQVRGRGEAFYRSDIEPRARTLTKSESADFDPLELLLSLAHEAGIEVHAWVNVYFTWSEESSPESPDHVVNRHPEWITADSKGVRLDKLSTVERRGSFIEGVYLSPGIPEVRRYIADVAAEIVSRYPVDGVHLDYVRYPGGRTGLDDYSREQFRKAHVFDPLEFFSGSGGSGLFCGPLAVADMGALWGDWRADQVTALVSLLSAELRAIAPEVILSAAVRPDPRRARAEYGQDWIQWLKEGHIDLVAPMIYTESSSKFFRYLAMMKGAVPDSLEGRILAGISLYNQNARHAAEKIEVARAAGLKGFVLFSYDSAVERKESGYLQYLKAKVLNRDSPGRTASAE